MSKRQTNITNKKAAWSVLDYLPGHSVLLIIIFLSLVMKLFISYHSRVINIDGTLYLWAAQSFADGRFADGFALYELPLYSLTLAFVNFFLSDWHTTGRAGSIAAGVLTLVPLYLATQDLFGKKPACWACLFFAILPASNEYSIMVIRGPLGLFFFAWAAYFGDQAMRREKPLFFALSALIFGFSVMLRIEMAVFYFFYVSYGCWKLCRWGSGKSFRSFFLLFWIILPLSILGIAFGALATGGYFSSLYDLLPRQFNRLQAGFLEQFYFVYDQLKILEEGLPAASQRTQNIVSVARHYMPVLYLFGFLEILGEVLFPLFLIPLFLGLKNSSRRQRSFWGGLAASYLALNFLFYFQQNWITGRYIYPVAFLLFPYAGFGMTRLMEKTGRAKHRWILTAAISTVFVLAPIYKSLSAIGSFDASLRDAAEWFQVAHPDPETERIHLVSLDHRFYFYAGVDLSVDDLYYGSRKLRGKFQALLDKKDYQGVDQLARMQNKNMLIFRVPQHPKGRYPEITGFELKKSFPGKKSETLVYQRKMTGEVNKSQHSSLDGA